MGNTWRELTTYYLQLTTQQLAMKLRTEDQVKVMTGKDKGKTGKIIQVFPALGRVVVEGVNSRTKHVRARGREQKGQKISYFSPLAVANVMLVCPKCGKTTRVAMKVTGENKLRVCKKCQETL